MQTQITSSVLSSRKMQFGKGFKISDLNFCTGFVSQSHRSWLDLKQWMSFSLHGFPKQQERWRSHRALVLWTPFLKEKLWQRSSREPERQNRKSVAKPTTWGLVMLLLTTRSHVRVQIGLGTANPSLGHSCPSTACPLVPHWKALWGLWLFLTHCRAVPAATRSFWGCSWDASVIALSRFLPYFCLQFKPGCDFQLVEGPEQDFRSQWWKKILQGNVGYSLIFLIHW